MFKGDGKRQTVKLELSNVTDHAHYEYNFIGDPDVPERVTVKISPQRMFQQPVAWGVPVRFNQDNAVCISFQTHEDWRPGSFDITIWDLRIHP